MRRAFSSKLRDLYTAIGIVHVEPGLFWKKRHCAIPLSSFVVRCTRVAEFLCFVLLMEAAVMVALLIFRDAAKFVAPYDQILGSLQIWWFPDLWDIIRVDRFCRTSLTLCLSSRTIAIGGCWDFACRSVCYSTTHLFHISMTVVVFW